MNLQVRGIRGAITVSENDAQEILEATKELFDEVIKRNHVIYEDIVSVHLTVTADIDAEFPAKAISQQEKWRWVPMLCSNEIAVPKGLARCIRLLLLVNSEKKISEMHHVFLRDAVVLRPDLAVETIDSSHQIK